MSLFRTVVGIDPSGGRLALTAQGRGLGLGRAVSPVVTELRSDREPAFFEEAEKALLDFVTRNGLSGSSASLCIPAERVYTARLPFPRLRERDMRPALELEMERLFPVPPSRLRFGWSAPGKPSRGGNPDLLVAAAPAEYIEKWEAIVSRAGLSLTGAVPAGWAVSAACVETAGAGEGGITVILRRTGDSVECTVAEGGTAVSCSSRPAEQDAAFTVARSLVESGLSAADADGKAPVNLVSPDDLRDPLPGKQEEEYPFTIQESFVPLAARAMGLPEGPDAAETVWAALGAFGAAVNEKGLDLLRWHRERVESRATAAVAWGLALAAFVLALAWPGTVYWKTKRELARLDSEIATVSPAAAGVETAVRELADLEERAAVLKRAAAGRGETLLVLKELTERLPEGTWLTGLRMEEGKVSIDGVSSSATELFPLLTRGGRFRKVEYGAPITRQADNLERFQIRAEFVPVPGAKGEGGE